MKAKLSVKGARWNENEADLGAGKEERVQVRTRIEMRAR